MTTAHRPTFDPARGKEAQRGVAYHQRLLPAHTQLKTRQPGQGGDADPQVRDLRAQLLEAEAAHYAKANGTSTAASDVPPAIKSTSTKRQLEAGSQDDEEDEDIEAKRRRVLEETRDIDADSDGSKNESSDEESDEEDETAELLRELEKIKRERAEQRAQEESEKAEVEQEKREHDIALGNPLLNPMKDVGSKRRWDDDVVFRNQARGTENKGKKEFVNDLLRSDFHKRFMVSARITARLAYVEQEN
ncbi:complexed with cef1p [Pseudocyphellaria aurata]|nr:complexed with cef1p [Pseudocyphellaria aurata]